MQVGYFLTELDENIIGGGFLRPPHIQTSANIIFASEFDAAPCLEGTKDVIQQLILSLAIPFDPADGIRASGHGNRINRPDT